MSNGTCLDCQLETIRRARERDPERFKRYSRETGERFAAANPGYGAEQYRRHGEKRAAYGRTWVEANRVAVREIKRRWKRKNPEWVAKWARRRERDLRQAAPSWLTDAHRAEIAAIYQEARARGPDWHVDHIVPLRGKGVCGLHVPWNLQILPATENCRKGNRLAA